MKYKYVKYNTKSSEGSNIVQAKDTRQCKQKQVDINGRHKSTLDTGIKSEGVHE